MYRFLKTVIKKFNEINIKMPHFIVISIYVYPFLLTSKRFVTPTTIKRIYLVIP